MTHNTTYKVGCEIFQKLRSLVGLFWLRSLCLAAGGKTLSMNCCRSFTHSSNYSGFQLIICGLVCGGAWKYGDKTTQPRSRSGGEFLCEPRRTAPSKVNPIETSGACNFLGNCRANLKEQKKWISYNYELRSFKLAAGTWILCSWDCIVSNTEKEGLLYFLPDIVVSCLIVGRTLTWKWGGLDETVICRIERAH